MLLCTGANACGKVCSIILLYAALYIIVIECVLEAGLKLLSAGGIFSLWNPDRNDPVYGTGVSYVD